MEGKILGLVLELHANFYKGTIEHAQTCFGRCFTFF